MTPASGQDRRNRLAIAAIALVHAFVFVTMSTVLADHVTFRLTKDDGSPRKSIDGEILVEAADGGIMIEGDDGQIWIVQPEQLIARESSEPPAPIDAAEMAQRRLAELPAGFEATMTAHYVILHGGNETYARQVGTLFESLYRGFFAYFKNGGIDLHEPTLPLVAIILPDRNQFRRHARSQIGDTADHVIGYYHLPSNAMTTYRINNLERNIATLIHEATHQLSYNCGLQTRFADNPMWLAEGLAMFFESPDFSNPRGWRGIGRVNQVNLNRWQRYQRIRPADSLRTLIADDQRFRDSESAEAAYGEAWALTYFLLKTRRSDFLGYLETLREAERLRESTPRQRIETLERALDTSLEELDDLFVRYMRRVRA
ncbi:MAG: DUF1570 domain-containing protein [Planctomycetota bacterium]